MALDLSQIPTETLAANVRGLEAEATIRERGGNDRSAKSKRDLARQMKEEIARRTAPPCARGETR
jgi:hypothetical protein